MSSPLPSSSMPVARVRKGDVTRAAIVDAALVVASREGLEGLTLGGLSETLGMSKSGVFAHFGSREELQLAVLRAYAARFVDGEFHHTLRAGREVEIAAARTRFGFLHSHN